MSKQQASVDVLTGDKIIAEFMDLQPLEWKHSTDGTDMMIWVDRVTKRSVTDNQHLFYHSSWDWLLPSWGKLSSLLLAKGYFEIIEEFKNAVVKNDICSAWVTVVKGIKLVN